MAIIYNPNKKIFTLHTAHTTYQMQVDPLGYLLHLYYGEKTNSSMDYVLTYADRGFSGNPYAAGMSRHLFAGCAATGISVPWHRRLPQYCTEYQK